MDIKELLKGKPEDVYKSLSTKVEAKIQYEDIKKQLDPKEHDVFDVVKRPMKTVKRPSGQKDSTGKDVLTESKQEVNRIAIPFQRIIVNRAVGFLLGNSVKLKNYAETDTQKRLSEMIQKTWDDNKLDYFNRKLARKVFSECEVAELWYLIEEKGSFWQNVWQKIKAAVNGSAGKYRLRVKMLSQSSGDKLYPYYDETGDMVAFSREYQVTEEGKKITRFDVYTAESRMKLVKRDTGWELEKSEANPFKKIPVIYYKQDEPEWYLVQSMIDRFETLISNFGDTNDYFGSPMIFTRGKILGFAEKGEQGKVLQGDKDAQAEYLSWESAPEAIKLEIETLKELIYSMTQTPDITFSQMKSLGNLSGVALKLLFMDAHLKVENHIELFGEMFQRRINLIKQVMGNVVDVSLAQDVELLDVEPVFTPYMPRNVKEDVEMLVHATNKPVLSVKTALEHNPLASDPETELALIEEEAKADLEIRQMELGATLNF